MAQRGDSLLEELDAMSEEFSRRFGLRPATNGLRGWLPPVDVWETPTELVIESGRSRLPPGEHPAEIVETQLVVTGERSLPDGAVRRYRTERWQGRFVRSFVVPRGTDGDKIKAEYHEGVLTLRLPKPETARPKRITIGRENSILDEAPDPASIGTAPAD